MVKTSIKLSQNHSMNCCIGLSVIILILLCVTFGLQFKNKESSRYMITKHRKIKKG